MQAINFQKLSKENSSEVMVSNNVQSGVNTSDTNFRKPGIHSTNKSRLDPEAFKAQLDVSSENFLRIPSA